MEDRLFLDTNILVYMYSGDEPDKRSAAACLVSNPESEYVISTQVIGEFVNILVRKLGFDIKTVKVAIDDFKDNFEIKMIQTATIDKSMDIMESHGFSYWDSMIVASALENRCPILYSEDLQNNQIIEGRLKIVNPFKLEKDG